MSKELYRTSALHERHIALGSGLEDWNGMGTAWSYHSDPNDEHDAIRNAAGLFDMSPLKKIRVTGADALMVVDYCFSRDVTSLAIGCSSYGTVLTEEGTVADDAIVMRLAEDEFLFVHGSGASLDLLEDTALHKNVTCLLDDDLHNISLQGPKSLNLLNNNSSTNLRNLAYFHHVTTSLFGYECLVSRTGYSGERGYEIFCQAQYVVPLWDMLLQEGASDGVMACSFTALDKVRIEAGLLFFGYDMSDANTPWEVGLGFTINATSNYRGKAQAMAARHTPAIQACGIVIDHDDALIGGEIIQIDGKNVGVINSPCYSHRLQRSLALGHIAPDYNIIGLKIDIINDDGQHYKATLAQTPFYDASKTNTHQP